MNTDKILAEAIAKDYAPKKSSKIVALKKLDAKAKLPSTVFTYTWGIIFSLVFGTGMCMAMEQISGGTLRIQSEPGKGTVVTIEIPKKQVKTT